MVHCVDPFDATGDSFSVPIYRAIRDKLGAPIRQVFDENIFRAGLTGWVKVHQGRARDVAATWTDPLDMLFLDGDQSYEGAQEAYKSWSPFLKIGGIIAVHNSAPGSYNKNHDGQMRLVAEKIHPPSYEEIRRTGTTTFAQKISDYDE